MFRKLHRLSSSFERFVNCTRYPIDDVLTCVPVAKNTTEPVAAVVHRIVLFAFLRRHRAELCGRCVAKCGAGWEVCEAKRPSDAPKHARAKSWSVFGSGRCFCSIMSLESLHVDAEALGAVQTVT